jgi:UDP-N-acetyl-D-mannosaminuronic acid dehydrogenase
VAARAINEGMPGYAVGLLERDLGEELEGVRVLILGVTYRGDVKQTAFSGAFPVARELEHRGALVLAADPLYSAAELLELGFEPWDGDRVDAAVVQADHSEYRTLRPSDVPGARVIVDGRDVIDSEPWVAAGIPIRRIGRP